MASEHSFDVVAEVDIMELKNAIAIAKKEISTRFDFKGLMAEIDLDEKAKNINLTSTSDNKVDSLKEVLISKLIKRGINPVSISDKERLSVSGGNVKLVLEINDTLDSDNSKKITKAIKDSKIKVNASIRGQEIRVVSKSIDDLQECIKLIKGLNLELPLSFKNLK